jgi:aminoglycoside phosphotransferase (APT) family kinase protein
MDKATKTRTGEELDDVKLNSYLKEKTPFSQYYDNLEILQFPSGFSNLTYLVRFGDREFVLRKPPFGANIKGGHDMHREYRILSALQASYSKVPKAIVYCDDPSVIGSPFYVMERVKGLILRANTPLSQFSPDQFENASVALIDTLAELHQLDYKTAGLGDLGNPTGYTQRQVNGWIKRYENAKTDEIKEIDDTTAWLNANVVNNTAAALIHNDYKYDNVIFNTNISQILAILDWEMATIGDPLTDLGTTLAYWADSDDPEALRTFNLTHTPNNLTRKQVAERYAQQTGANLPHLTFYYVYGLFKICVILQQIYARYRKGFTKDTRFASLIQLEKTMARMCIRAIDLDRIDRLGLN